MLKQKNFPQTVATKDGSNYCLDVALKCPLIRTKDPSPNHETALDQMSI